VRDGHGRQQAPAPHHPGRGRASSPGDEIGVCPGTYADGAIVPAAKSGLEITALGAVIIDATSISSAFDIQADDVTVERFEILGSDAAITVAASGATIRNNDIHDVAIGVDLSGGGHVVRNNVITVGVNLAPIFLTNADDVEIASNRLTGGLAGILGFAVDQITPGTVIQRNIVTGAAAGIAIGTAGALTIRNNTVHNNTEAGIAVVDSADAAIVQNLVQRNGGTGIDVEDSTGCTVSLNSVAFNGSAGGNGITLTNVDGCTIARNNASRNTQPDCVWDGAGANTFTANACATEAPPGAWD
jgi:parallel beta-helix repeat protein